MVVLSSIRAEYIPILELCTEILLKKSIWDFLDINIKLPIIVYCDNIGALYLGHNAKLLQRTKHAGVKSHFVRDYVGKRLMKNCVCEVKRKRCRHMDQECKIRDVYGIFKQIYEGHDLE